MREVNITELRNHLPTYMKAVQKGEPINIVSRGRVIARIIPAEEPALAARQRLIALREKCSVGDVVSPSGEEWDAEHGRL
jgi:prevent-host-death family protein